MDVLAATTQTAAKAVIVRVRPDMFACKIFTKEAVQGTQMNVFPAYACCTGHESATVLSMYVRAAYDSTDSYTGSCPSIRPCC